MLKFMINYVWRVDCLVLIQIEDGGDEPQAEDPAL